MPSQQDLGLDELEGLGVNELRTAWTTRLGSEPPKLRTRELLSLALAYRLQAKAFGDLKAAQKRKVAELQRRFAADRSYSPVPGPDLKAGTAIIKEWRGDRHTVLVTDCGFSYRGDAFKSLSEVARHITGTNWNGHVFFGLKARRQ